MKFDTGPYPGRKADNVTLWLSKEGPWGKRQRCRRIEKVTFFISKTT
jgi:hypothetical protein